MTNKSSVASVASSIFDYLGRTFPVTCASDEFIYFPQFRFPEPEWSNWDNFSPDTIKETVRRLSSWEDELHLLSLTRFALSILYLLLGVIWQAIITLHESATRYPSRAA